jgi:SNF2 family DNA or RNA helicase
MLTYMANTGLTDFLQRCRLKPFNHQLEGIHALVENPTYALFDEMGVGKTKQVIDAAQILYAQHKIDRVIIVAPTPVRDVWYDEELGELQKHLWVGQHVSITLFHAKNRTWTFGNGNEFNHPWDWIITNYEFIRKPKRLNELLNLISDKTLLVLDESSAIKNYRALQTKAAIKLRKRCQRVILLNGTPITLHPGDMFGQGQAMDPNILACKSYFHFRSKYAVLGGFQGRQIITWRNIEDIQERFKPYVIRRLKINCLDLPEKLEPVTITATLTQDTWNIYKEMRDEMIAWLSVSTVSVASQAVVKALRLSQLTSGFLGGIQAHEPIDVVDSDYLPGLDKSSNNTITPMPSLPPKEVSQEKLDVFLKWYDDRLNENPNLKLLVWCRFRPELSRLKKALSSYKIDIGAIHGGQKQEDRNHALRLLDLRTMPEGPVVVVGTPASGSMGLNLTAAHTVVYLSNDYSLKTRLQSEDRVHRPGQTQAVSYFDVIAVGPQGQKTIDHAVMKSLRKKESLAMLTTNAWISLLKD